MNWKNRNLKKEEKKMRPTDKLGHHWRVINGRQLKDGRKMTNASQLTDDKIQTLQTDHDGQMTVK